MAKFYAGTGETAKASVILTFWKRHLSLSWQNQIPQLSSIWVCLKMSKQFGDLLSTSCHEIMEDMVNMMIKHQMLGARIAAPFEKSGSIGKWWVTVTCLSTSFSDAFESRTRWPLQSVARSVHIACWCRAPSCPRPYNAMGLMSTESNIIQCPLSKEGG